MFAAVRRLRPASSRQQLQRSTRRTPSRSTAFHPVSSQSGQGIGRSVEVRPQPLGSAEFFLRPRFDLADALARQVQPLADLLQRTRLVVFQPEAQADDFALLAVEI